MRDARVDGQPWLRLLLSLMLKVSCCCKQTFRPSALATCVFRSLCPPSILANLKHVNILPFHGLVLEPTSRTPKWLVTSYATGRTLAHQLVRRREAAGGITLLELVDIMADILDGLAYLHCRKPEPIILR